jgi:uncharacterized protein YciI
MLFVVIGTSAGKTREEIMAIFRSRAAAEAFAKSDPFLLEGAANEYQIKEWADGMLS